jgi:hypothetical protein
MVARNQASLRFFDGIKLHVKPVGHCSKTQGAEVNLRVFKNVGIAHMRDALMSAIL